ncbi:MAG TPA: thioredoxin family protein [Longimicrobium sp.]
MTGDFDYRKYWDLGFTWDDYLGREVKEHRGLWEGVWGRSQVPEWALRTAARIGGEWRLLVTSEDWCGDASNTVPVAARLAEVLPNVELRVVKRDEHPELMDRHLTNGSRSIPLVVVLRPDFTVAGTWGPRPTELQQFVLREKHAATRPTGDIYREARQWYARDRGETTIREILGVFEQDTPRQAAA